MSTTAENDHPGESKIDQLSRPVSYSLISSVFAALFGGFMWATKKSRRAIPEEISTRDVVLVGVATHKLSNIITRDRVTSYLRAPFTLNDGLAPAGQSKPLPRGGGLRRAVGELITCPFCTGVWIASGLTYGLVLAPRSARLLASVFASVTVADFLHRAYQAAKHVATEPAPALERKIVEVGGVSPDA